MKPPLAILRPMNRALLLAALVGILACSLVAQEVRAMPETAIHISGTDSAGAAWSHWRATSSPTSSEVDDQTTWPVPGLGVTGPPVFDTAGGGVQISMPRATGEDWDEMMERDWRGASAQLYR